MADAEFTIYLGNGLYMDSNGTLSGTPGANKVVYSAPGGGLPVKPEQL